MLGAEASKVTLTALIESVGCTSDRHKRGLRNEWRAVELLPIRSGVVKAGIWSDCELHDCKLLETWCLELRR
jgi:hypothetical protein